MRGELVGSNMVTNYRGLPAVGYREMTDFDLQQEVSAKAGITRRLMSSPFMAEMVTASLEQARARRGQVRQRPGRRRGRAARRKTPGGSARVNPLDPVQIGEARALPRARSSSRGC